MHILVVLSWCILGFWVLSLVSALRARKHGPQVRASPAAPFPNPVPLVSVVVPARDEEHDIDACVRSLRAQDYPQLEILVVDDGSTDGTPAILARHAQEDPRVKVLTATPPADGWLGKPNAVRQGVALAQGQWILMTDADTVHHPNSLRNGLAYIQQQDAAALSLTPRLLCLTFWEKVLMPSIAGMIFTRYAFSKVNNTGTASVFGVGTYFLVRRDAYEKAGGMEAVRGAIDEDVVFARALKGTGLGYRLAAGDAVYATRMYAGLAEIFHGFARNTFATMHHSVLRALRLTVFVWLLSLVPITTLGVSLFSGHPWAWAGVLQFPLIVLLQGVIRKVGGFTAWVAVVSPVGGMMMWLVVMNSVYRGLKGKGPQWKGRTYGAS